MTMVLAGTAYVACPCTRATLCRSTAHKLTPFALHRACVRFAAMRSVNMCSCVIAVLRTPTMLST